MHYRFLFLVVQGPKPKTMKFFEGYSSFDQLVFDVHVSTYVGAEFGNREVGAFGDGVPLSLLLIDKELPSNEVGGQKHINDSDIIGVSADKVTIIDIAGGNECIVRILWFS